MGIFKDTIFNSVKNAFSKTRENVSAKINSIFKKNDIGEEEIEEIENILLQSDFGIDFTSQLVDELRKKIKKGEFLTENSVKSLIRIIFNEFYSSNISPAVKKTDNRIIILFGINGAGKTTTLAKLANYYQKRGNKVIIGSCDTFRAAANEQLATWAQRAKVRIVEDFSKDPSAVAYEALRVAKEANFNIVLIDTAGRLHTNKNLIDELKKIVNTLTKIKESFCIDAYLVIDGNSGQNAKTQLKEFSKYIAITGLIITKLDGTAKGGSIIDLSTTNRIPIEFIGIGEDVDSLIEFNPTDYINSIIE
jgi:fused signal recognition particle receptor